MFVKMEGSNPTGSMKDRMALAMVTAAEREGLLRPGQPVVEITGGSTGSSLALVCNVRGHPLTIVTADCFAPEKARLTQALGATVEILKTPGGKTFPGLQKQLEARAAEIRDSTGAYWTQQFANQHQLEGYRAFAEEILRDCPMISHFVQSVGTAGSSMGTSRVLKATKPSVRTILVEPEEAPFLSRGIKGSHRIDGIATSHRPSLLNDSLFDDIKVLPERRARETARSLAAQEALAAGTSTGLNVAAALDIAATLDRKHVVVTIAVDTALKYLSGDLYPELPPPTVPPAQKEAPVR